MQRERSVVAEAVERAPACDRAHEVPVLPLVEKRTGLLARPRRREKSHAILVNLNFAWHISVQHDGLPRKSLFRPKRCIVARENSRRLDQLGERRNDLLAKRLESGAHELNDEPRCIAIAHERWTSIGFTVYEAKGIGVLLEGNPPRNRRSDPRVPPRLVDDRRSIRVEQSQRDLRLGTPERPPERLSARVMNEHRPRPDEGSVDHVATVDPTVPARPPSCPLGVDLRDCHARKANRRSIGLACFWIASPIKFFVTRVTNRSPL